MHKTFLPLAAALLLAACAAPKHGHHHTHDHHHHNHEHGHHHHDGHDHHGHDHDHHHAPDYTAWQEYRCAKAKYAVKARYDAKMAEVSYNGKQAVLPLSKAESNADLNVYSNGKWAWFTDKRHGFYNTKNHANGFLYERTPRADKIIVKNCEPVK
ncbi:MAG: hypothetical protein Q4A49_03030 [Neisseria sp.]|nr:hypothetical protein [Neisseria sp.]